MEEEISYPPTYRYERGSRDTYVWQKQKATGVGPQYTRTRIRTRTPTISLQQPHPTGGPGLGS